MPKKSSSKKKNDTDDTPEIGKEQSDESEYEDITISSENNTDIEEDEGSDISIDVDNNTDNYECIYNNVHIPSGLNNKQNKNVSINDDYDTVDYLDDSDQENTTKNDIYIADTDRRTRNSLTKYEVTRLLGERTTQLSYGAKPMLNGVNGMPPRVVAQLELESKMLPIKIVRILPNGKKEIWSLDELILKDIYIEYGFTGGTVDKDSILQRTKKGKNARHLY